MSNSIELPGQCQTLAIAPSGGGFQVTIPSEALTFKAKALATAGEIKQVTNAAEQVRAIHAAAAIKGLLAEAEKHRAETKSPYWEAGKAIDAKAKEFAKELEEQAKTLENLVSGFQRAEAKRIADEAAAAAAKQREIEAAAKAEQEKAASAAAEAASAAEAAAAATGRKKAALEAEAARAAEAARLAELDAMEAQDDAAAAFVVVPAPAPVTYGASVRSKLEFEVTDIEAFYAWDKQRRIREDNFRRMRREAEGDNRPIVPTAALVKLEIPKREFNDFISTLDEVELAAIPGVKFTRGTKVSARGLPTAFTLQ